MGYAIMMGSCYCCGKIFGFHPHKVPSIRDGKGIRQPVCQTCVDAANLIRPKKGLNLIQYSEDAYGPCDEAEL